MTREKSRPALISYYEWLVGAWRNSETVRRLNATHRGIFRELLDQCYVGGDFEYDEDILCRLCVCTKRQLRDAWAKIQCKFPRRKNGRHFNRSADRFRRGYAKYIANQRRNAISAHEKKCKMKDLQGPATAEPVAGVRQNHTTPEETISNINLTTAMEPAVELRSWPKTVSAIRSRFSTTPAEGLQAIIKVAIRAKRDITDTELAALIPMATTNNQQYAGLYRTTLPGLLLSIEEDAARKKTREDAHNLAIIAEVENERRRKLQ